MSNQKYKELRSEIIKSLKVDLMGPLTEEEVLDESPLSSYITGMLYPQMSEYSDEAELENAEFMTGNGGEDNRNYSVSADEEEEIEQTKNNFKKQSSAGIRFYVNDSVKNIRVQISWGEYTKTVIENEETEEKKKKSKKTGYLRKQKNETVDIDLSSFSSNTVIKLDEDPSIKVIINKFILPNNYILVSVYLSNERESKNDRDFTKVMFQVELSVSGTDGESIFVPENKCRAIELDDEFYYENRPIYARGYGCAANWKKGQHENATEVWIEFIPEHEVNSVSPVLDGFFDDNFSMRFMSKRANKDEIIRRLRLLNEKYLEWIDGLKNNYRMENESFVRKGKEIIDACKKASDRIESGIKILEMNSEAFEAFCFMNQAMYLQRSIEAFSKKYGRGISCSLGEFTKDDHSKWRPFQLAFILLNIEGCVNKESEDRNIVDLLYFPTGGGKTEAYLGIIAFVIAFRRLTAREDDQYEKDGGVTVFLRYTLRLLTTQQRDRLTKLIIAAEMLRDKKPEKYGHSRISIGFWVGGGVTPNKFSEFIEDPEDPIKSKQAYNKLIKQIIKCPLCGTPIEGKDYVINNDSSEVKIYCHDSNCYFYKYKNKSIPVYVVDEEIYRKCPTVVISTVDKFARLPWDEKTGLIFGSTDRYCERHGYLAIGEKHAKRHNKKGGLKKAEVHNVKQFYPPELIVQDELHLITGPLGTIYGGYETVIEDMCTSYFADKKYKPKYIVSTATIKNAKEQIRCLYGRENYAQFPPSGFDISDSFFMKEVPLEENPFRNYCGICAPGQSMKTTVLRVYAILLQTVFALSEKDEYKDYIDPYYTLIGYFNSIRELGGTVRLLQDDIPNRIRRIKKKYGHNSERFINNKYREITSRISSYKIAELLEQLTIPWTEKECLHAAVATNMIAVGMDVDRLGLMTVVGQPKQNSEYIQATSRIGRKHPGLVVMIYNPYRPRDLSHYENFKAFHSHLYRYVEGTTATPFSARARDRVLHALVVSISRLRNFELAPNKGASYIDQISDAVIECTKKIILNRVNTVAPKAYEEVENEMDLFIEDWKRLNEEDKKLFYYIQNTDKYNRLLNYYGEYCTPKEKATLNSMREVEAASSLFYYVEGR